MSKFQISIPPKNEKTWTQVLACSSHILKTEFLLMDVFIEIWIFALIFVRLPYLFDISAISKNAMKNILTLEQKRKTRAFSGRMNFQQYSLPFLKKNNWSKKDFLHWKFFWVYERKQNKNATYLHFLKDTPSAQKKLKRLNLISQKNQFARWKLTQFRKFEK